MNNPLILSTEPSVDFELLDSGDGEKLERYGNVIVSRPDPQALWKKKLPPEKWRSAHAKFSRDEKNAGWKIAKDVPERWQISLNGLKLWIRPTAFKHVGLFPEHAKNWEWMAGAIQRAGRPVSVINLFGYTGAASLAAAAAGADVCHVDGSKVAVQWARDNAKISGLGDKPIRWIMDDVRGFVKREIKRGKKYDGILMDPPAFGHGAKKELWRIEEDFVPLLDLCAELLSDEPLFLLLNGYASGYSALAYENNMRAFLDARNISGGIIESGELTIAESGEPCRLLPCGIFSRWSVV